MANFIYMKHYFATILLLFVVLFARAEAFSQPTYSFAPTDTVPYVLDEDELVDYSDSLISFPAYDLYCGWDTVNTHSAKFDISSLYDCPREIVLYDKNSCGYVHPFSGKVTSTFCAGQR